MLLATVIVASYSLTMLPPAPAELFLKILSLTVIVPRFFDAAAAATDSNTVSRVANDNNAGLSEVARITPARKLPTNAMMALHLRPWEEGLMAVPLSDTRELSDEVLEVLRLRALHGCELGFTEAEVADLLGVRRETVCRWWTAYAQGGLDALPRERTRRP